MVKVSDMIDDLKAAYPGYRVRATVRGKCLPRYGYGRFARRVTEHDANQIRRDIAAVMYMIAIEDMVREGQLG